MLAIIQLFNKSITIDEFHSAKKILLGEPITSLILGTLKSSIFY